MDIHKFATAVHRSGYNKANREAVDAATKSSTNRKK